jgi:hypothetical protein
MHTGVTQDLAEQVAGTVGDQVLLREAWVARDEHGELEDPDPFQVALSDLVGDREDVERGTLGQRRTLLGRQLGTELAGAWQRPVDHRQLPRGEDQVTVPDVGLIRSRRRRDRREHQAEVGQSRGGGHAASPSTGRLK